MWSYIWPKDNRPVRRRVVSSLGLLVVAKALNVQVGLNFLATLLHDYFKTFSNYLKLDYKIISL